MKHTASPQPRLDPILPATRRRLPYHPPILVHHGDVRGLTLGPSIGTGESGNATIFRVSFVYGDYDAIP